MCNILFTVELANKLEHHGIEIEYGISDLNRTLTHLELKKKTLFRKTFRIFRNAYGFGLFPFSLHVHCTFLIS